MLDIFAPRCAMLALIVSIGFFAFAALGAMHSPPYYLALAPAILLLCSDIVCIFGSASK